MMASEPISYQPRILVPSLWSADGGLPGNRGIYQVQNHASALEQGPYVTFSVQYGGQSVVQDLPPDAAVAIGVALIAAGEIAKLR